MISNTDWQNTRSIFHHPDFKQKNQAVPYRLVAIAMENASETAKKAAACITLSNENDGVAAALRLIFIT